MVFFVSIVSVVYTVRTVKGVLAQGRAKSEPVNERDEIRTFDRVAVTQGGKDMATLHDKYARELPPIGTGAPGAVATENRRAEPRPPHAGVRQLANRGLIEAERPVKPLLRIADASQICHTVVREPAIGLFGR